MTFHSRLLCLGLALALVATAAPRAQQQSIDAFFDRFTADWVRANPNQATNARYFTGQEQDSLERQIGQLTLVELREKMRSALGARFDPKAYHDLVLSTGTVPLTLLEQVVDRAIAQGQR